SSRADARLVRSRVRRDYLIKLLGNLLSFCDKIRFARQYHGRPYLQSPTKESVMRLTTKGRFAVTAMIDLALRQQRGPVTLATISERQNISLSYLEQLFGKLRRHELVDSVRGPGGGYSLARLARNITVADIIFAVDEPLDATNCGGKGNCKVGRSPGA